MSISRSNWGRAIGACFLSIAMLAFTPPAPAQPDSSRLTSFDIPAQNLATALTEFARQSGQELFYLPEMAEGKTTNGVSGAMTTAAAMDVLLDGTGLEFERTPNGSLLIGDRATLDARRAEWESSAAADGAAVAGQNTIGQRRPGIEEIIVTGQKREERIQDVPIAISAFSPEDLEAQKIEGGFDLLKGVPNVTFSKTNFTGYNFQIRGIGTQAVSATTDPGVAVSFNNTTLIVNRLFEQEYLDVERVEVLRGPQGTLFGRNATAGVINVISNKPELGVWDGMLKAEVGNFNARRLRGMINIPLGDSLAIRGAYASTKRDGFGINEAASDPLADVSRDVDDRDLWTGRITVGWQPTDRLRFNLLWERFEEDDHRVRTSKQLCHNDENPESIGISDERPPQEVIGFGGSIDPFEIASLSQGCEAGSLYDDAAFGTPNGASLPYVAGLNFSTFIGANSFFVNFGNNASGTDPHPTAGLGGNPFFDTSLTEAANFGLDPGAAPCEEATVDYFMSPVDACNPDPYRGLTQSRDLREIFSLIQPQYQASADIVELSWDLELTDNLLFSSQTVYASDEYDATQDYNRFTSFPIWNDSSAACDITLVGKSEIATPNCNPDEDGGVGTYADGFYAGLTPDGVLCDPQLGCSDSLVLQDLSRSRSTQYNQEFRLVSSYAGDWNFSLGANFTKFQTRNEYFVFGNGLTYLLNFWPFNSHTSSCLTEGTPGEPDGSFCRYVDPHSIDEIIAGQGGDGHNYFLSDNPYKLDSTALFGELYWNVTDTVKLTAGLRLTWDQKVFSPIPSQLLLGNFSEMPVGASVSESDGPEQACGPTAGRFPAMCPIAGNAPNGRGSPADPDIVQSWREPTGRLVADWQPVLDFTDETMVYASFAHGYKGGGANPPTVAPPARFKFELASSAVAPRTFEPEFVNAYEVGTKNTLFDGALVLNATAFYYDYTDYQISKIVDRTAVNENFDAKVQGFELEAIFAPSLNWQFNTAIGYLDTKVGSGEQSVDLMDRVQGGEHVFRTRTPNEIFDPDLSPGDPGFVEGLNGSDQEFIAYDHWTVVKPFLTAASNCIVPTELLEANLALRHSGGSAVQFNAHCPAGNFAGASTTLFTVPFFDADNNLAGTTLGGGRHYDARVDAPNGGAGFFADLGGNELPNAPRFTVALGGQYSFDLTRDWRATARMDYYWQDESFARIYNTEFDRLKSWSNTNLSFWVNNPVNGITVEAYVKNVFDETPITGTFLNSDDSGLTTNVFTLDPRLIGVSLRKEF